MKMGINYEMARYTELTGQDGTKVSVSRLGGYLDGYDKGREDAEEDAENRMNRILDDEKNISYEQGRTDAIDECVDIVTRETHDGTLCDYLEELKEKYKMENKIKLEKTTEDNNAKELIYYDDDDKMLHCPCCEGEIGYKWHYYKWLKYCFYCGQKIKWV